MRETERGKSAPHGRTEGKTGLSSILCRSVNRQRKNTVETADNGTKKSTGTTGAGGMFNYIAKSSNRKEPSGLQWERYLCSASL